MPGRRRTSAMPPAAVSAPALGPVGRVVASLLVIAPEWLMFQVPWYFTILGLIAYPVLIVVFVRAIWGPVVRRRRDERDARNAPPPEPSVDWQQAPVEPVIAHRTAPQRW